MAKQITKAMLQAQVAELTAALEAASAALAAAEQREAALRDLKGMMHERMRDLKAERDALATPSRRLTAAGYVPPAWQAARAEAMAKAKAMAMQIGRSVRVG